MKHRRPPSHFSAFEVALGKVIDLGATFATEARDPDPLKETWEELNSTQASLSSDIESLAYEVAVRVATWATSLDQGRDGTSLDNATLSAARKELHNMAGRCRDLTKQIDLTTKLAHRAVDIAVRELDARASNQWDDSAINTAIGVLG